MSEGIWTASHHMLTHYSNVFSSLIKNSVISRGKYSTGNLIFLRCYYDQDEN